MKRTPLMVSLALALSVTALPAQSLPDPSTGGPAELLRLVGDPSSATGNAVSNGACDVNGDGDDDAVVGAWFWDKGASGANMGAAYVLLGGADAHGASLADPTGADAVRIDGPAADAKVGFSVGCLGDVNGDGYDDIGIGDYLQNRAFVIFGAADFTGLGLDAIGDRGFIVKEDFTSTADRTNLSYSMSAVGDIDDDGLDDFALSAVVADTQGRSNNGKVWVIAGRDDISDVDLSTPAPGEVLLSVDGALSDERLGAVAKAGDVNGDGIDDFVLGSYTSKPWGPTTSASGAAYVVFGGNTGTIDLLTLGTKGFKIFGPQRPSDRLGIAVSSAGDVDDDGLADLLIGADGVDSDATPRNGGAAVVLGSASTATVYTDPTAANGQAVFTCPADEPVATCATPARRGYWINGAARNDSAGYSVAGIGDVNADDVPDFAIGAWAHDPVNPATPSATMGNAGATYVVHGRTTATVQELSSLTEAGGHRIDGLKAGDRFGRQVGAIGDFDGNGVSDLVVAADFAARGTTTQNGELTVALMGRLVTSTTVTGPSEVLPTETASFTATVAKRTGDRTPLSEGTMTFSLDGAVIDGCSAIPVVAGSAPCTAAFDEEISGDLVASFDGSSRLQGSEARQGLTVAKMSTTTALHPSATDPRPGQLVQLRAAVADADSAPLDEGSVTFSSDGQPIAGCKAVALDGGDAVCTTSWSSRSEPQVTATYGGTSMLASSTSGAQTLAVGVDAVIKPSATPAVTYGTQPAAITGEIRGGDGTATGTVEVRQGGAVLARSTVENGEYALLVGATALRPGGHTLTLVYSGDDRNRGSQRTIAVAVSKAQSRVSVSRSRGTLQRGQRLTVRIGVGAKGVAPGGTVQVKVGSKVVRTLTLRRGKTRLTLPRFTSKGTKKVSVVYRGSGTTTSATKTVKVVQK